MKPAADADFTALQERYRLGLGAKCASIAADLERLRGDASHSPEEAATLAHRLQGTAGSFGFAAVGVAAGRLERVLAGLGPGPVSAPAWDLLTLALGELAQEICVAQATPSAEPGGQAAPGPRRVLLVDDEEDIRTIGRIALEDVGGLQVFLACCGQDGLRIAAREQPDVILLDVMMPGMDGPTTLARLQRDPATAAIPVVFVTAKAQHCEIERYLAAGARGVIAKPFDPMSLPDELRRVLLAR